MFLKTTVKNLAIALAALLLSVSAAYAQDESDGSRDGTQARIAFRNLDEGQPAHDFNVKDTGGNDIALSGFAGKVVVAVFFRPDQETSQRALADLEKLYQRYASKGVIVLAITPELEQQNKITEIIQKENITYPVLLDAGRKVYGDWGVFLFPTTGVLDKDGKLAKHISSYNRKYAETVEGNVRLVLGEINKDQLESMLNPKGIAELTPEQKKAERHMMLGQRMVDRKLLDKAAEEYSQAVESDPNLVEARVKYGFVLLKLGDNAKALENFSKAVELNPKAEDARTGLGAAQVATGELDKGIGALEDALKLNPKPARAHYELGKAYEKKGVADKALEHYRKAVEELAGATW